MQFGSRAFRNYCSALGRVHMATLPRTYLEIGVSVGRSLALSLPGTTAVGVDPAPDIQYRHEPGAAVLAVTSDEFFARRDLVGHLGGTPVDVTFIDGLHLFEQALRDVMNAEAISGPNSLIILHDTVPPTAASAGRTKPDNDDPWTGDVWKVIVALSRARPDIVVTTLDVPPSGLTLLTKLDPASTALRDRYDALVEDVGRLRYEDLAAQDPSRMLHVVPNRATELDRVLAGRRYREGNSMALRLRRSLRLTPTDTLMPTITRNAGLVAGRARRLLAR